MEVAGSRFIKNNGKSPRLDSVIHWKSVVCISKISSETRLFHSVRKWFDVLCKPKQFL
jgi:hypothetical protein